MIIIEFGQGDHLLFVQMFDFLSNENLGKTLKVTDFVNEWVFKKMGTQKETGPTTMN